MIKDIIRKIKEKRNRKKLSPGYVWAPYIMIENVNIEQDVMSSMIKTRYSKKMVDLKLYKTISKSK